MVFWAAGFPAADALLQIWHPVTLILLGLITVLCVLYPLWIWMDGRGKLRNIAWARGFFIGFFGFGIGTALLLFAQWYTDPVTVALIATTTPIMATLLEVWQGDRKISIQFLIGLIASVIGGVFAVGDTFTLDTGIGLFNLLACPAFAQALRGTPLAHAEYRHTHLGSRASCSPCRTGNPFWTSRGFGRKRTKTF
jgi:drug/metabolite transporter (DMT)-like permease